MVILATTPDSPPHRLRFFRDDHNFPGLPSLRGGRVRQFLQ